MLSVNELQRLRAPNAFHALTAAAMVAACGIAWAQNQTQIQQPEYRVASEAAAQAAVGGTVPAQSLSAAAPQSPFNLEKQGNEHPLAPMLRVAKECLAHINQSVQDYSCTLVKRERVGGELGEFQHIFMKVRHEPFSVYMQFVQPFQGREVLFVDGQHENEMVVLEAGWKRKMLGKMQLDPEGMVAMRGQKYPITKVGMKNLLKVLVERAEADTQFAECEVTSDPNKQINGRAVTMIQIVHPVPRQNFHRHIVRLFLDNELRVPIHYDAFSWPAQPGGQPPLEESYTYTNLKLNNNFTSRDFDSENPDIFKP